MVILLIKINEIIVKVSYRCF